jgi:hypothetical protein
MDRICNQQAENKVLRALEEEAGSGDAIRVIHGART